MIRDIEDVRPEDAAQFLIQMAAEEIGRWTEGRLVMERTGGKFSVRPMLQNIARDELRRRKALAR